MIMSTRRHADSNLSLPLVIYKKNARNILFNIEHMVNKFAVPEYLSRILFKILKKN